MPVFAQTLEITTPWVMVVLAILGIVSSFALYVMRMEMKSFVQSAVSDAIESTAANLSERTKEINRRIDSVERDHGSIRLEVSAMSTQQHYLNLNVEKLENSIDKMDNKIDMMQTSIERILTILAGKN